ncbi:threonylcarbamoyl-AMP synthase [Candidatus Parcubacteria bacterium]|nr:threonylcarbamoyl-AMP synthase [Patescibacteria group bacterium]MBU4309831.1 threonylcarbamoyl-AMP synthase [Patescibacteria group bacterium]MBU4432087.1 threonylcarbamoyl-AMP synthase [Patescibacteria group bacterium]MBU4578170.1 threonylcarbamoyl-AMP synthase [Patescibacteria group bacterium]MCG2696707.1 threonylcarbamoyl-AMP synthase [Candidatus Parcubacteria bacterium]
MILLTRKDILENKDFYIDEIKNGKVFIYPTDTLFGLGIDATNQNGVERIFQIKNRNAKPMLIIAPSWQWLKTNCVLTKENYSTLKQKLPGAYSFVVNLKNKTAIYEKVNNGQDSLGVRIPDCWFTELIQQAKVPFVTTSVNLSGQASALKISEIPEKILAQVDYVIDDETSLSGKASTIIDLRGEERVLR